MSRLVEERERILSEIKILRDKVQSSNDLSFLKESEREYWNKLIDSNIRSGTVACIWCIKAQLLKRISMYFHRWKSKVSYKKIDNTDGTVSTVSAALDNAIAVMNKYSTGKRYTDKSHNHNSNEKLSVIPDLDLLLSDVTDHEQKRKILLNVSNEIVSKAQRDEPGTRGELSKLYPGVNSKQYAAQLRDTYNSNQTGGDIAIEHSTQEDAVRSNWNANDLSNRSNLGFLRELPSTPRSVRSSSTAGGGRSRRNSGKTHRIISGTKPRMDPSTLSLVIPSPTCDIEEVDEIKIRSSRSTGQYSDGNHADMANSLVFRGNDAGQYVKNLLTSPRIMQKPEKSSNNSKSRDSDPTRQSSSSSPVRSANSQINGIPRYASTTLAAESRRGRSLSQSKGRRSTLSRSADRTNKTDMQDSWDYRLREDPPRVNTKSAPSYSFATSGNVRNTNSGNQSLPRYLQPTSAFQKKMHCSSNAPSAPSSQLPSPSRQHSDENIRFSGRGSAFSPPRSRSRQHEEGGSLDCNDTPSTAIDKGSDELSEIAAQMGWKDIPSVEEVAEALAASISTVNNRSNSRQRNDLRKEPVSSSFGNALFSSNQFQEKQSELATVATTLLSEYEDNVFSIEKPNYHTVGEPIAYTAGSAPTLRPTDSIDDDLVNHDQVNAKSIPSRNGMDKYNGSSGTKRLSRVTDNSNSRASNRNAVSRTRNSMDAKVSKKRKPMEKAQMALLFGDLKEVPTGPNSWLQNLRK